LYFVLIKIIKKAAKLITTYVSNLRVFTF